jgi:hypothetical protein
MAICAAFEVISSGVYPVFCVLYIDNIPLSGDI